MTHKDKNTVTYDAVWEQGDVYGLGDVNVFLNSMVRPDLFDSNRLIPLEIYLKLDAASAWIKVPYTGSNSTYTYDGSPFLVWIICYPNNFLLVNKGSLLKIKI